MHGASRSGKNALTARAVVAYGNRDQLIIRGFLRTRTVKASQISGITLVRGRYQQYGPFWVPYVHLHGGGSIRLAVLMAGGTRAGPPATLVAHAQEIASLLGVQMRR